MHWKKKRSEIWLDSARYYWRFNACTLSRLNIDVIQEAIGEGKGVCIPRIAGKRADKHLLT